MTAKHKLNAAHFQGALVIAGMVGALTRSYLVFLFALAALIIASILARDIRR